MRHRHSGLWLLALAAALLAAPASAQNIVVVSGNITSDTSWGPPDVYLLRGAVFVEDGASLTIAAGTTIYGENATTGTLVVAQGGKIFVNGTREAPVIMTSDRPAGQRGRADWGGLILNGRAPINVPGGVAEGEGDTGSFGGNDPDDSSGVLRYLRVEYAGIEFSPDNELNGIAFQGVGRGTVVDYCQVSFNKDDGYEWFGGTVDVKHLVSLANADDSFDWTEGWTGRAQFLVAQQRGDDADHGFECDNNGESNDLLPRSAPRIYNATIIGAPTTQHGNESTSGVLIRAGTAGLFRNMIVMGFKEWGVDIDHASTFAQAASGALSIQNSIFYANLEGPCNPDTGDSDLIGGAVPSPNTCDYVTSIWAGNADVDPMLVDPYNLVNPDWSPQPGSPALDGTVPVDVPPDDGFYDTSISYIGAIEPGNDWTQGWINTEQQ
jgi:hypothetical protein